MRRIFTVIALGFFLIFSSYIITACKQEPKEAPVVEEGAEKQGKVEESGEPQAVAPMPVPTQEETAEEAPAPEGETASEEPPAPE